MNWPLYGAFSAAEAACLSAAQALRAELRGGGVKVLNMFAGPLDTAWFQSVPPPKLSPAALASATVDALRAGVEGAYIGDVAQDIRSRLEVQPKAWGKGTRPMSAFVAFAAALGTGAVRVIDLTQTLTPEFAAIVMPPELGQCAPFRWRKSRYDERGPAWYWNNFSMGEHTGTHFDAPIHWITGKELPKTRSIPFRQRISWHLHA